MNTSTPTPRPPRRIRQLLGLRYPPVTGLLAMLLLAGALLVALHLSQKYLGEPEEFTFDLGADRGFGEFFQYLQIAWATMMLGLLALRTRTGVYAAWALVCIYFVADDALQIHEQFGFTARDTFPQFRALSTHIGELVWAAGIGAILIVIVGLAYRRADSEARAVSRVIAALFVVLIFFGVVLDGVHHIFFEYPVLDAPVTAIEDGGEIVAMSFMVAFLFAVTFMGHTVDRARPARPSTPEHAEHPTDDQPMAVKESAYAKRSVLEQVSH